jgi:hypothetical protein
VDDHQLSINGAAYAQSALLNNVGVILGSGDIVMAQQRLDSSQVVPLFQQSRGKAVPECVASRLLANLRVLGALCQKGVDF